MKQTNKSKIPHVLTQHESIMVLLRLGFLSAARSSAIANKLLASNIMIKPLRKTKTAWKTAMYKFS